MQNIKVMLIALITSSILFNYSNINVKSEVIKNVTLANATTNMYRQKCYYDIFADETNPQGLFEYSDANYKMDYSYTGTWWNPTWAQVHYYFDGCYSFLIHKIILSNVSFTEAIRNWVDNNSSLSKESKRAVLKDLFLDYLKIGAESIRKTKFIWFWNPDFDAFVDKFISYFSSYQSISERYIIESSLYNTFKSWNKSGNARWLCGAISWSDFSNNFSQDAPYDGGINYMIYYNYRNYEAFIRNLASASYQNSLIKEDNGKLFNKTKHFISERTSGGLNYLSYVKYDNINNVYRKVYY